MKKVFLCLLAGLLCLCLAACNSDAAMVETFVTTNHDTLVEQMENSLAKSNTKSICSADIKANGTVIEFLFSFEELEVATMTETQIQTYQTQLDATRSTYEGVFAALQNQVPQATGMTYTFCDKNGKPFASVTVGVDK